MDRPSFNRPHFERFHHRPCVGFGFYMTRSYCPSYYMPYYVAEPVFMGPPVVEQTVVVAPPVTYAQPPVVYGQPYGINGTYYDPNGGQASNETYDNTVGGGVVSTDVPAGVGGPVDEMPAQPQQAQQQPLPQPLRQPVQRQANPNDATLGGEQLYQMMSDGTNKFSQGAYEESARQFLNVTMQDPANVDASLAYAVARFATGDYAVSAVAIRRGISRLPDIVNSAFDIRDRYGNPGDLDRHVQALSKFLHEHPDNMDAVLVLGFVQHFTGQREAAKDTFSQLRRLSRPDARLSDTFLNAKPVQEAPAEPPAGNSQPAPQGGSQPNDSQPMGGEMPQPQSGARLVNTEMEQEQSAPLATPAVDSPSYLDNALSGYVEILE